MRSFKTRVIICALLLHFFVLSLQKGCGSSLPNNNNNVNNVTQALINSIYPTSGLVGGGTTIIVSGVGFCDEDLQCHFGVENVRARYISSISVECRTPPKVEAGNAPFSLTTKRHGASNITVPFMSNISVVFVYYEGIVVQSVYPTMGVVGTHVSVRGVNFIPSSTFSCQFGGVIVLAKHMSDSEVACVSPPYNLQEKVQVSVSVNGVDFALSETTFEYILSPPQISSIYPSIGSISGGTPLTIIGSGFFNSGALSCLFGKHTTVLGRFVSKNEVRCVTPEFLQHGIICVEVTVNGLDFATNCVIFRYIVPPRVSTVHPMSGPSTGKTLVVIHGHDFIDSDIVKCRFGKQDTTGRFISKLKIECRTPAGKAGRSPVYLTLNGVDFYEGNVPFEYHNPISIMSFSPKSSLYNGGTHVTLEGDNFRNSSDLKCRFGSVVVSAMFYTTAKIGCSVPAGLIGESNLTASNNGADFSNPSPHPFKYHIAPRVASISPKQGIASKQSVVSVFGSGFMNENDLSCSFGDVAKVPAKYVSTTELVCTLPKIPFTGFVFVEVSLNNCDYTSDGVQFELIGEPRIHKIWPPRGPVSGRTKVTVSGVNFVQRLGIWCHFGGAKVLGIFLSTGKAECEAPSIGSSGKVLFSVSIAGGFSLSNAVAYYYLPSALISAITPHRWAETWTGSVSVSGSSFYAEERCPWTCSFGETLTSGEYISTEMLACPSPQGNHKNSTFFLLYPCSQSVVKTAILLDTVELLMLRSVWPNSSPTTSSLPLIIQLTNLRFEERYICFFDDIPIVGFILNATHLTCESPTGGIPRTASLSVHYADLATEATIGGVPFTFFQPPDVAMIKPVVSQPTNIGAMISVNGHGFRNSHHLRCKFGDLVSSARWLSSNQIGCRTPLLKPGLYAVEVSNNAADFTVNNFTHEVLPELEIYNVSPREARLAGGVAIKVTGIGFHDSLELSCAFGDTLTIATVVDRHELNCWSSVRPWESVQSFKVCHGARICVEAGVFGFFEPAHLPKSIDAPRISIAKTSSSIVSDCGDAEIFLVGDSFRNSNLLQCSFMSALTSARITADWFSSRLISCRVPALQAGPYSLLIEFNSTPPPNVIDLLVISCPVITKIFPATGGITGGTWITVHGKDFIANDTFCKFGKGLVRAHEVVGSSFVRCRSVPGDSLGFVPFTLSFHGGAVTSPAVQYHYTALLSVHSISPEVVDQTNPVALIIYGSGFAAFEHQNLTCRIGGTAAVSMLLDKNHAYFTCCFDNFSKAGTLPLEIEGYGHVLVQKSDAVHVVTRPIVSNVSPSWGLYSDINKKIVVSGKAFVNTEYLSCFFNDRIQRAIFLTTFQVECLIPDMISGEIRLEISNDRRHSSSSHLTFQLLQLFSIQTVIPDYGWAGTSVTIRGRGFIDGICCGFGSSFSNATVLHQHELKCVVPQRSWLEHSLYVPVQLLLNGVILLPEVSHHFRFVQLSVDTSFPLIGSTSGGTAVTIRLRTANAHEVKSCRFGEEAVLSMLSSSDPLTEVICIAPATASAGIMPLSLSANGADFVSSGFSFSYVKNPSIVSIYPDNGPWRGGTIVTVFGSNFREDMHLGCKFGRTFANGSRISSDLFFCLTPVLPVGSLELFISVNKIDFITTDRYFESAEDINLTELSPNSSPVNGEVNVTIRGTHFRDTGRLSCRFDDRKVLARFISSREVVCLAPSEVIAKQVQVAVTNNGYDFYACPMPFRYHSTIEIYSFFPQSGPLTGLTLVTFTGYDFLSGPSSYTCIFGESFQEAVILTNSTIICDSPPSTKIGRVQLVVSGPGFRSSGREGYFTYQPIVETFGLFPPFGSYGFEQVINIYGSYFSRDAEFCCKIRGTLYPAEFLSPTEAKCVISDVEGPGLVDITLSNNGQNFAENTLYYEITEGAQVAEFRKSFRYEEHGVVIVGTNFLPFESLVCQFSDHFFTIASVVNLTHIECNIPFKPSATAAFFEAILLNGRSMPVAPPDRYASSLGGSVFSVQSVTPRLSATIGDTFVYIRLRTANAKEVKNCKFGEDLVPAFPSVSDPLHDIICITPATANTGSVLLSLSANGVDFIPSGVSITYVEKAIVESIFPDRGPSTYSTIVQISGSNFREDMHLGCRFGETWVIGSWVSMGHFSCATPLLLTGTHQLVIVGDTVLLNDSYLFYVYNAFPVYEVKTASVAGRREIILGGKEFSFSSAFSCQFADHNVPARFINSTRIGCMPPPSSLMFNTSLNNFRDVKLQITANGQDYLTGGGQYTFHPPPIVIEINPNKGKARTHVSVTGIYFAPSLRGSFCKFGSLTVPADVKSNSTLCCTSPPSKQRRVALQVSINGGLDWSLVGNVFFEYYSEARVKRVVPSIGVFKGDTPVAVYGVNFVNSILLTCRFGDYIGTKVVWISSTQVNCHTPAAHEPKAVQVQVANNKIDFSTDMVIFEYHGYPHVSSIFPLFGFPGTKVVVFGKNFFRNGLCKFGTLITNAVYINAGKLECIVPFDQTAISERSEARVQISNNGLDFSTPTQSCIFTYAKSPIVHYISPTEVFMLGGDSLAIHGTHLNSTGSAWCLFSPLVRKVSADRVLVQVADILSDSLAKCVVPPQAGEMRMEVRVSVNSAHDRSTTRGFYTYRRAPRIVDIIPRHGSAHGGASVVIIGNEFPNVLIECMFGSTRGLGSWLSPTNLQCTSPPANVVGLQASVSVNVGGLFIQSGVTFYYLLLPTASDVFLEPVSPEQIATAASEKTGVHFTLETLELKPSIITETAHSAVQVEPSPHVFSEVSEDDFLSTVSGVFTTSGRHFSGLRKFKAKEHSSRTCIESDAASLGKNRTAKVSWMSDSDGTFPFEKYRKPNALRLIRSISPVLGPDTGNSTIIVKGNMFADTSELYCHFGATFTHADFISEKEISCKTPMMPPGNTKFSVTASEESYFSAGISYMFYKPVHIDHISPSFGSGGTTVQVHCTNLFFVPLAVCRFGKIHVTASFSRDAGVMLCLAPDVGTFSTPSRVRVTVSLNGIDVHGGATSNHIFYTYVPHPVVLSLSPNIGWKKGGSEVFVRTTKLYRFPDISMHCVFGEDQFAVAALTAAEYVKCVAPPMRTDRPIVSVRVTYGMLSIKTMKGGPSFTYIDAAVVSRASPSWGSVMGGTFVDVYGENFLNLFDLCCKFSEYTTPAEFVNKQHVKCISPGRYKDGDVALVQVVSRSGSLETFHSEALFEYYANPSVSFIEPLYGTIEGGTFVTIHGDGFKTKFSAHVHCRFGEYSTPVPATFVSEHAIMCTSPPAGDTVNVNDNVTVSVSLNGRDFVQCNESIFTYLPGIYVMAVDPALGVISGGTVLTVKTSKSPILTRSHDKVMCVFEGEAEYSTTPATVVDDEGLLVCRTPSSSSATNHPVVLSLSFNGNETSLTGTRYYYYMGPDIHSFSPSSGTFNGGEQVEVSGVGFLDVELLGCIFGSIVSPVATWVSSSKILCRIPSIEPSTFAPNSHELNVVIGVTINGVDYSYANEVFLYVPNPTVSYISPQSADGNDCCIIHGNFLEKATACRLGLSGKAVHVLSKSKNLVTCEPTNVPPYSPYDKSSAQLYFSFGYHFVDMNISFSHRPVIGEGVDGTSIGLPATYEQSLDTNSAHPELLLVIPTSISSSGGEWITVHGARFSSFRGTGCLFGANLFVEGQIGSNTVLYCKTPSQDPGAVALKVVNGVSNLASWKNVELSVYTDSSIASLEPNIGSIIGGTPVVISGVFAGETEVFESSPESVLCRFGSFDVAASRVSSSKIVCLSPPNSDVLKPENVTVSVSFNNGKSFSRSFAWYSYEKVVEVHGLIPSFGVILGGTNVLVQGVNFRNSELLKCKFGNFSIVNASFLSSDAVHCLSPIADYAHWAKVEITNNGVDFSRSGQYFEYHQPSNIDSAWPLTGPDSGGTIVTIRGSGFVNSLEMACVFGRVVVFAHYVDSEAMLCISPPGEPGLVPIKIVRGNLHDSSFDDDHHSILRVHSFLYVQNPFIHAIYPSSGKVEGGNLVFITGEWFINSTHSSCQFGETIVRARLINHRTLMCKTPPSRWAKSVQVKISLNGLDFPVLYPMLIFHYEQFCGKGYVCGPSPSSWGNESPNGTYAPDERNMNFTLCEPGYFQPITGQAACVVCPAPYICPDFGLSEPLLCPAGFVCDKAGLSYPSQPCPRGHFCATGTGAKLKASFIDLTNGTEIAYNDEGPISDSTRLLIGGGSLVYPIPCPVGHYCRDGVSSISPISGNFSTPQTCFEGHICPRGSFTPEGTGPCTTGYYCPTAIISLECPRGHFCPGVGNIKPIECNPGTYGNMAGQSTCSLCEIGHVCPGWGRMAPDLCPPGYVCDTVGLPVPYKLCPSGFYCELGTATIDPDDPERRGPRSCPAGAFCIGGIAHNKSIDWLPRVEEARWAPQKCLEGYYCSSGSSSPKGTGSCLPGHYCPPESAFPVEVSVGTFSAGYGSIAPSRCFPGTFTPITASVSCRLCPAGASCISYATYIPRRCDPGTYRSMAGDGIACLPCPLGTFAPFSGANDVTECLPCPEGRVCGLRGMSNISDSGPCEEGQLCGFQTDRDSQFDHQSAAGYTIIKGSIIKLQFSSPCPLGFVCSRGSGEDGKSQSICPVTKFCPGSTSRDSSRATLCPSLTVSRIGSFDLHSCNIDPVDVCDKVSENFNNPFEDASYYALDFNNNIVNNESNTSVSQPGQNIPNAKRSEVMVLKKITPVSVESIEQLWKNDTVDVIRSCPSYGFLEGKQLLTIVGRNFMNSTSLTCRFTVCSKESVRPTLQCESKTVIHQSATFLSTSRVSCRLPSLKSDTLIKSLADNQTNVCGRDPDGAIFYFQECNKDEFLSRKCDQRAFRKVYSLLIPCTSGAIDNHTCENIPEVGMRFNPCFSGQILVEISNNGEKFSGDPLIVLSSVGIDDGLVRAKFLPYTVPGTLATFTYIDNDIFSNIYSPSNNSERPMIPEDVLHAIQMDKSRCMGIMYHEEGERSRETGWFALPFMQVAQLSFDWRQIPEDMQYDEHFRLAIYVKPSRCDQSACDNKGIRIPDKQAYPCVEPIELPKWFTNRNVSKHQLVNVTITALDDVLFKAEIHIIHGLLLASADFFMDTMSLNIGGPRRAKRKIDSNFHNGSVKFEQRRLSPLISYEERLVEKEYFFGIRYSTDNAALVSSPLNMPPRWKQLERGRVLVSMNATQELVPVIKDSYNDVVASRFWENPFNSPIDAKVKTDAYLETFHGVYKNPSDEYGYNLNQVVLPYLPFFSNCYEYDSFVTFWALVEDSRCALPEASPDYKTKWWRRDHPPLPNQDSIRPIGPFDFATFNPVADWCERLIHCTYEENLKQPDSLPRWFEAGTGVSLFSFIRDPIDYFQFTGREGGRPGPDDGGGTKYLQTIKSSDAFIPVLINRDAADDLEGGCRELCFPRKMRLEVLYYQMSPFRKRIVESSLIMDDFDKNSTREDYNLQISFRPLDYEELVIKFVYGQEIFVLFNCLIGGFTVLVAIFYWIVVRFSTRLESPPKLYFVKMILLIVPDACFGFLMGLLPIATITFFVFLFFRGYILSVPLAILGFDNWSLFDSLVPLHYADVEVNHNMLLVGQRGRMGLAFISMAAIFTHEGSKLFVPRVYSRLEKEVQERNSQAAKESIWIPHTWKRANFVFSSFCMGILLVVLVEFSFWKYFGDHIWVFLFGLQVLGELASNVVKNQVTEELLHAPIMMALGLVQGIMTLSANDFVDFLTSYIVGFGFMLLQRMYLDPFKSVVYDWLTSKTMDGWKIMIRWNSLHSPDGGDAQANATMTHPSVMIADASSEREEAATVEPIIVMYGDYSSETLSLLCTPCIIFIIMMFRRETVMGDMYGIKESDMKHYLFFSLVIIPFQIMADIFIHGSLELFHGWKIQDYLTYSRYRFRKRELAWRGLERNTLDECIDEDLRTMDHLCFSSQYYMMLFIHTSGIIYFLFGTEMMIRAKYNPFGDPAFPLIAPTVFLVSLFVKNVMVWISLKLRVWKPQCSTVKWHADIRAAVETFGPLNFPSPKDSFSIEKRMMEESFRFRFLDYNRNWLISQLPNILTPRTVRRSRPYLVNQFAKILTSLNDDISSDSEADDATPRFKVTDGVLNGPSRGMIKSWLYRAKRRAAMKRVAEPIIQRERGEYCEQCLSRKQLQVQTLVEFDTIENDFVKKYDDAEFVQTAWKSYWEMNQRYQTLCLPCISVVREKSRKSQFSSDNTNSNLQNTISGQIKSDVDSVPSTDTTDTGIHLSSTSKQILKKWHDTAKGNRLLLLRDTSGASSTDKGAISPRAPNISMSSKDLATNWLSRARNNLYTVHDT